MDHLFSNFLLKRSKRLQRCRTRSNESLKTADNGTDRHRVGRPFAGVMRASASLAVTLTHQQVNWGRIGLEMRSVLHHPLLRRSVPRWPRHTKAVTSPTQWLRLRLNSTHAPPHAVEPSREGSRDNILERNTNERQLGDHRFELRFSSSNA